MFRARAVHSTRRPRHAITFAFFRVLFPFLYSDDGGNFLCFSFVFVCFPSSFSSVWLMIGLSNPPRFVFCHADIYYAITYSFHEGHTVGVLFFFSGCLYTQSGFCPNPLLYWGASVSLCWIFFSSALSYLYDTISRPLSGVVAGLLYYLCGCLPHQLL